MALSFGRKKDKSAGEPEILANSEDAVINDGGAAQPISASTSRGTGNTSEEPIDESWFESFAAEAATQNASAPSTATDFSVAPATPQPQFSAYDTKGDDAADDFGGVGSNVNIPSANSAQANTPAPLDNSAFVDPVSGALSSDSTTSFDSTSAADATEAPKKKNGGLKKLLPVLAVLLVLGGGGAFWMSQQNSGEEDTSGFPLSTTSPISTQPASATPATAPPAATALGSGAPTAGAPTAGPPTAGAPTVASPADTKPSAASGAQGDPKIKAQLKKLWNEGLTLRKQNKTAAAKAKWNQAVKLARSKPGYATSAGMIQQAIDKLK